MQQKNDLEDKKAADKYQLSVQSVMSRNKQVATTARNKERKTTPLPRFYTGRVIGHHANHMPQN